MKAIVAYFSNGTWWPAIDSIFVSQHTDTANSGVLFLLVFCCLALHCRQNANNDKIIDARKVVIIYVINRLEPIRKSMLINFKTNVGWQ